MENNENLVEQIARAICPIIQPIQCRELCTNVGNCQELKDVCRKVVNGFSKDDTAVVLSKEEHELLKVKPDCEYCEGFLSRQTAEKILNDLWKERNAIGQLVIFEEHLKEKAKEFGVEIKE